MLIKFILTELLCVKRVWCQFQIKTKLPVDSSGDKLSRYHMLCFNERRKPCSFYLSVQTRTSNISVIPESIVIFVLVSSFFTLVGDYLIDCLFLCIRCKCIWCTMQHVRDSHSFLLFVIWLTAYVMYVSSFYAWFFPTNLHRLWCVICKR